MKTTHTVGKVLMTDIDKQESGSSSSSSSSSSFLSPLTFDPFHRLSVFSSLPEPFKQERFVKCVKVSPDGAFLLSSTEDQRVEVHGIDENMLDKYTYYSLSQEVGENASNDERETLTRRTQVRPGESVYDIQWYPHARKADSASACFITTCRDKPIQLFGSDNALLRGSYCVMNAVSFDYKSHCCILPH